VEDVKATPGKIADAVQAKTNAAVEDIKAIPGKVIPRVERFVSFATYRDPWMHFEQVSATISSAVTATVEDVKQWPQRTVDAVTESVTDFTSSVQESFDEAVGGITSGETDAGARPACRSVSTDQDPLI